MTVSATIKITAAYFRPPDNETSPDDHCMVEFSYSVTDGTTAHTGDSFALFPAMWGARKADRYIRERTAASILAAYSPTIDPEDVYIPLTS